MVFQSRAGIQGASAFDPFAPVTLTAYVVGVGLLLANQRRDPHPVPAVVRPADRR